MEKTLLSERSYELLMDSKQRSGIEKEAIQRFVEFCELNEEDVMLDTNCGRGDFIIVASKRIEHSLGAISDKTLYDVCMKNAAGHAKRRGRVPNRRNVGRWPAQVVAGVRQLRRGPSEGPLLDLEYRFDRDAGARQLTGAGRCDDALG